MEDLLVKSVIDVKWGRRQMRTRERTQTVRKARVLRSYLQLTEEKRTKKKMKLDFETSKVEFVGWRNPHRNWEPWVQQLCSIHQSTWKNAGIYEAVMSSVYKIKRHDDIILELASRWCSEANTFVFPWGEATLTLEDMLVLGGFSPLGISVLSDVENDVELLKVKEGLELEMKDIQRSPYRTQQTRWIKKFKQSGSELEHAAFLSLWLSRFVFPVASCWTINQHVFPIAAQLSKGIKIALGPTVLAMLYKDLTALTKWMCYSCLVDQSGNNIGPYDQCSSFHLVQTWAWERFPRLNPVPNYMLSSDKFPRLARWSKVKIVKDIDLSSAIDSSEKAFLWRPYDTREGRDPESIAECIKTTDLIGIDSCIERYQPERVSRQFGLNDNIDKKTDQNMKLLAKSANFQSTINSCYETWWNQQGYSKVSREKVEYVVDSDPPPGFPPKIIMLSVVASDSDNDCRIKMKESSKLPGSKTGLRTAFSPSVAPPDQQQIAQIKIVKDIDLSSSKDSSGKAFSWCPYGNHEGKDPESFAQCMKTTDIIGLNEEIPNDNTDKKTDQNMKLLAKSANFQLTITSCYEKWCNHTPPGFPPKNIILGVASPDQQHSAQIKMEDCVVPSQAKLVIIDDSNEDVDKNDGVQLVQQHVTLNYTPSDKESNEAMRIVNKSVHKTRTTERLKLPFLETGSRMSFLSSNASPDMEIEDDYEEFVHSEAKQEDNINDEESIMDTVNGSGHRTREDKREAADTEHDEIQGKEGISISVLGAKRSYLATSCDAESYTNERSKDSSFDLEARITRLESIVYAHIKALETARLN